MKTDQLEDGLREALARRAAEIPAHAGDRLRGLDYQPRARPRGAGALGVAAAVAALGAAGGGYLASSGQAPARPAAVAPQGGSSLRLANYTFQLPAGFKKTGRQCAPLPDAPAGSPLPGGGRFAAGAAAHGGCVEVLLATAAAAMPAGASPVQVGRYPGFIVSGAARRTTLYVQIPAVAGDQELVVSATGLARSQVIEIAARALHVPYGPAKK